MSNVPYKLLERINSTGIVTCTFRDAQTGKLLRERVYKNAITDVCFEMLAKRLSGEGNDCNITYGAIGTGAFPGTPAASTTLVTELIRKTITMGSYSSNVATIIVFFGAAEGNDTLTEFGLFGEDATGVADTGTMINHAAISETKTSSETLQVTCNITLT